MRTRSFLGAGALVLACAPLAISQSEPAPKWSVVMVSTIRPEARTEYEAWQKQVSAAYKKAEVPSRAVLQTLMGDMLEYITIAPLDKFASMDGAGPIERALGKEQSQALLRKGMTYVTSMRRMATFDVPGLSIHDGADMGNLAIVTTVRLKPGTGYDYDEWVKSEYLPVMKKAEVKHFWVNQPVFGADPNERVVVRLIKSMSELDAGPITRKVLSAEESRKLMSKSAGMVESTSYRIVRYRPDLSYEMAKPANQQSAAAAKH